MKTASSAAHALRCVLSVGLLMLAGAAMALSKVPVRVAGLTDVLGISAGENHVLAVRNDGTVWAWGDNSSGQLGDGTTTARASPVHVTGLPAVSAVAAGNLHSLALAQDGTVWAWGWGEFGQLGNGSTATQTRPVRVSGLANVEWIAAGDNHSLALGAGASWAWGFNSYGQLGDGTTISRSTPVAVNLFSPARVSAGAYHSAAVTFDRNVIAWGNNEDGQLGDGGRTNSLGPRLALVSNARGVSAGGTGVGHKGFTIALLFDGTLRAWGNNEAGQLGDGTTSSRAQPAPVLVLTNISLVDSGVDHAAALGSDGAVWTWGANTSGQLGDGTTVSSSTPRRVDGLPVVSFVSAGGAFTVALAADTSVWIWGRIAEAATTPPAPTPSASVTPAIDACIDHVDAVASDGNIYRWGNWAPILTTLTGYPQPVSALPLPVAVKSIACGQAASYALGQDGSVWVSGYAPLPGFSGTVSNEQIAGLPRVSAISAARFGQWALALDENGNVWGWGSNSFGQLRPDSPTIDDSFLAPQRLAIPTSSPIVAVSAGASHALALDQSGRVWIWGVEQGFLGVGSRPHGNFEVMPGLPAIARVSAGHYFSLALARDGTLWSWGENTVGALGRGFPDGITDGVRPMFDGTPARITRLSNVVVAAAGGLNGIAMTGDGTVWTWGSNVNGEAGDGTLDPQIGLDHPFPQPVKGLSGIVSIHAAASFAAAVTQGGAVYTWGWNAFGRIGNGTYSDQTRPQVVIGVDPTPFLDLSPENPLGFDASALTPFGLRATQTRGGTITLDAIIRPPAADIGKITNLYVFALAPASMVKNAKWAKDSPVPCVLAQLSATGELQAVSASNIQAVVSNAVLGEERALNVLRNAVASQVNLTAIFAGYGSSPQSMLREGSNRSVATYSQQGQPGCAPQAPKTGWWWNAREGGRGYSIEVAGRNVFFAAFHYDESGRAKWNFATGPVSMDGAYFSGDLLEARAGQTLTGPYTAPSVSSVGSVVLAFANAGQGVMVWPGGTVSLERLPFIPDGLTAAPQANLPEAGWWWNPQENGRGFFVEWQNGTAQISGYMYDASGNPIWYLSGAYTPDPNAFSAPLRLYGNGQSMFGGYRAPTLVNENAGTLGLRFLTRDTATMTLPGGRQVPLERMRF